MIVVVETAKLVPWLVVVCHVLPLPLPANVNVKPVVVAGNTPLDDVVIALPLGLVDKIKLVELLVEIM